MPVYRYIIAEQLLFVYIYWKNRYLSYRLKPLYHYPFCGCTAEKNEKSREIPVLVYLRLFSGVYIYSIYQYGMYIDTRVNETGKCSQRYFLFFSQTENDSDSVAALDYKILTSLYIIRFQTIRIFYELYILIYGIIFVCHIIRSNIP